MAAAYVLSNRILGFLILVVLGALLSACTIDGKRDSEGRLMFFSDARTLSADQSDLNIAMFIDPRIITKIEHAIRDNKGVNETITLAGSGRGVISTQRVQYGFFSPYAIADLNTPAKFRTWVEMALQKVGFVQQLPPEKIHNVRAKNTVGFKTIATINNGACFVARAGYRLGKTTIYDNDEDQPDTIVVVIYCDQVMHFSEFDLLMSGVGITEAADTVAIRNKLSTNLPDAKTPAKVPQASTLSPTLETHPVAIQWDGFPNPIVGAIEVERRGGTGKIKVTLPNNEGNCDGSYSSPINRVRSWAIACSNGLTASGSSESPRNGAAAVGTGIDNRGRTIRFSVGS